MTVLRLSRTIASSTSAAIMVALAIVHGAPAAHVVLDLSSVSSAQQDRATRPPPGARRRATGTAVVRGQVLDAQSGAPLRRAEVHASQLDSSEVLRATTDADGRYELHGLPAGRYRLGAMKDGFVGLLLGQRWPRDRATVVQLDEHQVVDRVTHRLPRAGVVSGRTVDEFGEPQANVVVMAFERRLVNGRRIAVPAGRSSTTNDLGEFRLSGLAPGRYYIGARYQSSDVVPAESDAPSGYALTYHPGTTNGDEAEAINLEMGQQLTALTLPLVPTPTFQITGAIRTSRGRVPSKSSVTLTNPTALVPIVELAAPRGLDGSFGFSRVPPGNYVLNVHATVEDQPGIRWEEFAALPVTVAGGDVPGVDVVTERGAIVSGKVIFERGVAPRSDLSKWTVVAAPVNQDIGLGPMSASSIRGDGSFELRNVFGSRLINVQGLPSGWELKQVLLNNIDIIDTATDFKGSQAAFDLRLMVTDRLTELSGSVVGSTGSPVAQGAVWVFADDSRRWTLPARYVRVARVEPNGHFVIRGLPAGRYLAVAASGTQDDDPDPQVLESLKADAIAVSLDDEERKAIRLMRSADR